jgi:hypothetical protein
VSNFADIYVKLEQERTPEEWMHSFQASNFYNTNVAARLKAIAGEAIRYGVTLETTPTTGTAAPGSTTGQVAAATINTQPLRQASKRLDMWHQFRLFTGRYFEILTKDTKNLGILLLQAPVIALLLLIGFRRSAFDPDPAGSGDFISAKTLAFLLIIVAVWFGTNNAAREIVKEAAIYKRERRIGLNLAPYLASKMLVQLGLITVQIVILLGITWAGLGLGAPPIGTMLSVFFTLLLSAFAGVMMGLLVSALNSNSDRVTSTVPLLLIPQIVFGGAIVALDRMGVLGNVLGDIMVSNWGYHGLGRLLNLDNIPNPKVKVEEFAGFLPPEQSGSITQATHGVLTYDSGDWFFRPSRPPQFNADNIAQDWLILGLIIVVSLILIVVFQLRKDKDYSR